MNDATLLVALVSSQILIPVRLPPSPTATIFEPSLLAEGVNRWRLLAEWGRRLRVRPSQPNLRGPRETPPGPTTWVRPATGWWERMNAGESPRNQGRSVKAAPVRFQKAVSRSKEKRRGEAPIGAPVRVMGRLFPPAGGTGFAVRLSHRVRRSAPALVGALPPRIGGKKSRRRPGARSPGAMAHGSARMNNAEAAESVLAERTRDRRAALMGCYRSGSAHGFVEGFHFMHII